MASDDGAKEGDSDNSDDEDNVLRQQDERRRAFILGGNGQAQVSRADISSGMGDYDDDEQESGGLSAKAGIILVSRTCCPVLIWTLLTVGVGHT